MRAATTHSAGTTLFTFTALKWDHNYEMQGVCLLWAGAGPPGGTVRRAAVRKRGSGSASLS